jgi:hypothetical protein
LLYSGPFREDLATGRPRFLYQARCDRIASNISMNDKQFEELQTLQREARELLKPKLAKPVQASAK